MVEQFNHKEKESGSPKVVCFEGISCCGKSTLIDGLASPDRGTEVLRFQVPRDLKDPTPEYFLANDMEKLKKRQGQMARWPYWTEHMFQLWFFIRSLSSTRFLGNTFFV